MSVTTKVHNIAELGADASSKLASVLDIAKMDIRQTLRPDLYEKYQQYGTDQDSLDDTIAGITPGTTTQVVLSDTHQRKKGDEVIISNVRDFGLYRLNGRQVIYDVEDASTYIFKIDTDDAHAYSSGGKIYEVILDDLETAEAYFAVAELITAVKDIKKGDLGIIIKARTFNESDFEPANMDEINKLIDWFSTKARSICEFYNTGNNSGIRIFVV